LIPDHIVGNSELIRKSKSLIETLDTADKLKSEKNPSPAKAGLFDLA
jgi:hypothetical protein